MGNICRSPTAEGVFRKLLAERGLQDRVHVESVGTHDYHVGRTPDPRACEAAAARGIDIGGLRARQLTAQDLERFDYVLAMDRGNLEGVRALRPRGDVRVGLLLEYARGADVDEVPDPYYGGEQGFERVLDLIEDACRGLLDEIETA